MSEVPDAKSSTVYKCQLNDGESVYLKIPFSHLKYQRELESYEILRGRVAVPELLDYWSGSDEEPGAILLSDLKGEPLSASSSESIAYQVGELHAQLHNITPPEHLEFKGIKNEFPAWATFVEDQFFSFAEDVKEVIDQSLYQKALQTFQDMKSQLPEPVGPSFIHMDFRPTNIITDGEQVKGVIDFESVRFGATEIDFTKLYRDYLSLDTNIFHAYKQGYTSIKPIIDLEAVLPFYRFTDAFNSIGWCKRRGVNEHANFLEENVARLQEMV